MHGLPFDRPDKKQKIKIKNKPREKITEAVAETEVRLRRRRRLLKPQSFYGISIELEARTAESVRKDCSYEIQNRN